MTNKEVIERLKWVEKRISDITYSPESFEALELAIKALEDVDRLEEENHRNFVNSQHIISLLIEENKKLRGEE